MVWQVDGLDISKVDSGNGVWAGIGFGHDLNADWMVCEVVVTLKNADYLYCHDKFVTTIPTVLHDASQDVNRIAGTSDYSV